VDDPKKWFTELYDEHYRRVYSYALAGAGPDTADDVASETFLIAWRRLRDIPDPPLPWLLGVARNLLRQQRDGGNRRRALAERVAALTTPEDLAAWDVAEHVVERDRALAAVAALSLRDLELLTLVMWHGLEPRDAAKVVGCTTAAFFVRLHRARRRLGRAFESAETAPSSSRTSARLADRSLEQS
jgi:RNA polymerase sigma factor (sigma-70 family)